MAKITDLPRTALLSGEELIPVVQNGETRSATMAALGGTLIIPIFGSNAPGPQDGKVGQAYYQKTPSGGLIFYGPKTEAGWGNPISLRGGGSGPLGSGSVTADTLSLDPVERSAIAGLLPVLQKGAAFTNTLSSGMAPIGVAPGLLYFESERASTIDMVYYRTRHLAGSSCYSLHIVDTAEAGAAGGGSLGVALDGPGNLNVGTFNRQGVGNGHGILAQRLGSGNGNALHGSFSSLGTGAGVSAVKQNANGTIDPGAPCGIGPALEVINRSGQGPAIDSVTTANNLAPVSNIFRRENIGGGVVIDIQTLTGGGRTEAYTSLRVLHDPQTPSIGAASVEGAFNLLGQRIQGAAQTNVLSLLNDTSGSGVAFGAVIQSIGANTSNRALRLTASGALSNVALEITAGEASFAGLVSIALPEHPDNASAAASLQHGTLYRTPTGEVRSCY